GKPARDPPGPGCPVTCVTLSCADRRRIKRAQCATSAPAHAGTYELHVGGASGIRGAQSGKSKRSKPMRIAVTGGNGDMGRSLIPYLLEQNHIVVRLRPMSPLPPV